MAADHAVLTQIALSKLQGTKPSGWERDGRTLFEMSSRQAYPAVGSDELEAAWRDGLAAMKADHKTEWDEYAKGRKDYGAVTAVAWDKVKLTGGRTDGDTFELRFEVDGARCTIECSDIQLLDPAFMLRKLVLYTVKDITCPFLGRKAEEQWRRNVVLPWLKSNVFQHSERETTSGLVEDLLREYCQRSLNGEYDPAAYAQTKRAIVEKETVYVPFAGFQDFVGKHSGNDLGKRTIKNVLKKLGFNEIKKGKKSLRYHTIKLSSLYDDDTDPSQTGSGQVHPDSGAGEVSPGPGADSTLDELRSSERTRPGDESGEGNATDEGEEGATALPDDPFASL